eukprot:6474627-Amphidinium_carterae.1
MESKLSCHGRAGTSMMLPMSTAGKWDIERFSHIKMFQRQDWCHAEFSIFVGWFGCLSKKDVQLGLYCAREFHFKVQYKVHHCCSLRCATLDANNGPNQSTLLAAEHTVDGSADAYGDLPELQTITLFMFHQDINTHKNLMPYHGGGPKTFISNNAEERQPSFVSSTWT